MKKMVLLPMLVASLVAVFVFVVAKRQWDRNLYGEYPPDTASNVTFSEETAHDGYVRKRLTFEGTQGEPIPALAVSPQGGGGPWPCIVMLYGAGQQKEFLDDLAGPITAEGFAAIMPEQYGCGERAIEKSSGIGELLTYRKRAGLNYQEARNLADALSRCKEFDVERLYLWGFSFGAFCCAPIMAAEPRFKACVFTVGGGDFKTILRDSPAFDNLGIWRRPAGLFFQWLFAPMDPVLYAGKISPRPILMLNALHDQFIPRSATEAFFKAANEPKEIRWFDTDHVGQQNDMALTVIRSGTNWLQKMGRP